MRECSLGLLILAASVCLFSACDYIAAYRPPWLNYSPPSQRGSYASYRHSHSSQRVRSARVRQGPRESRGAPVADVDHAPSAAPAPVSTPEASLSMAGDSGDRERAQRLLEQTDRDLSRARESGLTAAQQETYERASQLASRARRALEDDDCAAAFSLAGKALSLAAGIGAR